MHWPNKHNWTDLFNTDQCKFCGRTLKSGAAKAEHARMHEREGYVTRTGDGTGDNPFRFVFVFDQPVD